MKPLKIFFNKQKPINKRAKRLLDMNTYNVSYYIYKKDGVYFKKGYMKDKNLNEIYHQNPDIIDYLEDIVDNSEDYHLTKQTKEVIDYLTNL